METSGRPETCETGDWLKGDEVPEEVRKAELSVDTVRERGTTRARIIEPTASSSLTSGVMEGSLGVVSSSESTGGWALIGLGLSLRSWTLRGLRSSHRKSRRLGASGAVGMTTGTSGVLMVLVLALAL